MRPGWLEVGIVILITLLIFGPRHLPGLANSLMETVRGFKKSFREKDEED